VSSNYLLCIYFYGLPDQQLLKKNSTNLKCHDFAATCHFLQFNAPLLAKSWLLPSRQLKILVVPPN